MNKAQPFSALNMSIQHLTKHEYLISNVCLKAGKLQEFPKTLHVLYYNGNRVYSLANTN